MKHLYIGSGVAVRSQGGKTDIDHMSFTYLGESQDEAEGWAWRVLHETYPGTEGYTHHHIRISRVSQSDQGMIRDALGQVEPRPVDRAFR